MADILGLSRTPGLGAMMNDRIHEVNRNIQARNALATKSFGQKKQSLINNINGAKQTLSIDQDSDRADEGGTMMVLANDLKHVQDTMTAGKAVLGNVSKSVNAVGLAAGSVPQGDASVVENPLATGSNEEFSLTEDGVKGGADNTLQRAKIADAAARGNILPAPKGALDTAAGGGSEAPAEPIASEGSSDIEKAVSGGGKLGTALDVAGRAANVAAGGYDLYEDFAGKQKGLAGGNTAGKISNVAGIGAGVAEAVGSGAMGLEALGTGLDLTGAGAILGVPLQVAGLAMGAVALGAGLISDITGKESSDKSAVASAKSATAGNAPTMEQTQAYQSSTMGGGYAGKADSQGRTQGTGAF
tara:strand:- start:3285 stop:4358 length:1074 start_codon:yes stop_codon:yes gene_type:complete